MDIIHKRFSGNQPLKTAHYLANMVREKGSKEAYPTYNQNNKPASPGGLTRR